MSLHRWQVQRIAIVSIIAWGASSGLAAAQETASIDVPAAISFAVTDVTKSTSGAPSPVTIGVTNINLGLGKSLRISVQADAASFTGPNGSGIAVSSASWSAVGMTGGTALSGTLSSSSYGLVFQSGPGATSAQFDLAWTLAAPGGGIRAGLHQLTVRWKLESITP
jgi:hypothetical protein